MLRATAAAGLDVDHARLTENLAQVRQAGYITFASPMMTAITDVSAPVFRGDVAEAALTVPFVDGASAKLDMATDCIVLQEATASISAALSGTT